MAGYPSGLAREHTLFDGRKVLVRPIRIDDDLLVRDFLISGVSGESRYMRFHKWVGAPSDKLIHFLTDVDYDRHMAFVCIYGGGDDTEVAGEARYVVNPDGKSCEFGVVIADAWHKSGIAGLLMEALIRVARERGLRSMEGLVLRNNPSMLRFARALGFEVHAVPEDPLTLRIVKTI
ncbi:MAG TPA: GNAT family N-acetyltransferase [Burkholderiales bacterium]|nr:GNAT family N-acetyltransferase [Burkholderiales bacterium]